MWLLYIYKNYICIYTHILIYEKQNTIMKLVNHFHFKANGQLSSYQHFLLLTKSTIHNGISYNLYLFHLTNQRKWFSFDFFYIRSTVQQYHKPTSSVMIMHPPTLIWSWASTPASSHKYI